MNELIQTAQEAGITIEYCSLPLTESITVQDDEGDIILIDYSLMNEGANARVHLAHEVGHSKTGAFYNIYSVLDIRQKHENRADKWAITHLISVGDLDEAVAEGYTDLWSLAEHFNVTVGFMQKVVCWYTHGNLAADLYF